MILVTGCNERYLLRMMPYLGTLLEHADFPVYLVGVGFQPPQIEGINSLCISRAANEGAPSETESIQHGSFINVLDISDDEVVIYTDGDFLMQRAMDDQERSLLAISGNAAVTSWNGGPHETLGTEAGRLGQKLTDEEMTTVWGEGWQTRPIYNVGFLALTAWEWEELRGRYMIYWPLACESFSHQARQQWLISYLLDMFCSVTIAPWSLHAHGHFGLKPGMSWGSDGIYADGKKALFRHFL